MTPLLAYNTYLIDLPLLIVLISLVYSATRYERWDSILREALRWALRLTGFLGAIGVVLYLISLGFFWTLLFLLVVGVVIAVLLFVAGLFAHQRGS
jgi:hypothetical protein